RNTVAPDGKYLLSSWVRRVRHGGTPGADARLTVLTERRSSMWLSFVLLLLGTASDQDEAAALFKRMEQKMLECKTLRVQAKITAESEEDPPLSARLFVAEGNRLRFDVAGTLRGTPIKTTAVSNGAKLRRTFNDAAPVDRDPPRQLGKRALAAVTRV